MRDDLKIRWMIPSDMFEVEHIEWASFEYPWGHEEFLRVLRKRECIGRVAEHKGLVVGFILYELAKTWIKVLNLAVEPEHRLKGIGRHLLDNMKAKLAPGRRRLLRLKIRERNVGCHLFLRALGFKVTAILKHCYEENDEDAYCFTYRIGKAAMSETEDADCAGSK